MAIEQFIGKVSIAVSLTDDFSKESRLAGVTKVFLKEDTTPAMITSDQFHVFADLAGTDYTVRIENKYYFNKEVNVHVADLDQRSPVVGAVMRPSYLYPYPTGATLVRGSITDANGSPVAGATASIENSATVSNQSEPDGRFVLYFEPLTDEMTALQSGIRYVVIAGSTTITLKIEHPNYAAKYVNLGKIAAGTTRLITAPITLVP